MVLKRSIEIPLTLVSISILLAALVMPALRTFSKEPYENFLNEVAQHFSPFDYFYFSRERLVGEFRYKVDSFKNGNINIYYSTLFNDSSWSKINVPFLLKATSLNNSIWIRTSFKVPIGMKSQKLRIVFSGVWGIVKVWLNGIYLGEHASYFSPFFFDVDDAINREGNNVLTMHIESPIQGSFESRIYPAGAYSFSEVFPNMRDAFTGVWRDIVLVGTTGPVVNLVLVDVEKYSNPALVKFRILVQNKEDFEENLNIRLRIKRLNSSSIPEIEQSFRIRLSPKETGWRTLEASIPDPAYWFPWDVGDPAVYLANISLYQNNQYAGSIKTIFGIRFLEGGFSREKSYIKVNGASIFLRGGAYFSRIGPMLETRKTFETVRLLKDANVNFLRSFAHVEPKEFYESTSVEGLLVQLDFPLIGSYPALDRFKKYSDSVKKQLIEMILLTYNYPSIVIICPHTLPGWLNEKSPYYGYGVNLYLDYELSTLAKDLNRNIIVLPYSGDYDEYLDYGWGTGSWTGYISYRSTFPNIISPIGLPSLNSPFWSNATISYLWQVAQTFKDKGFNGAIPTSLTGPDDLFSLVDLSQKYQSVVLRHSIDRARMLKNNYSMGVSIFPLTDYFPQASGSIIDYYGVRKNTYNEIKNAFNPVHVIIFVDGDYYSNLTSLCFNPGATVRVSLWVVNDAFEDPLSVVLNWTIKDLTFNKILYERKVELKLPSLSSGAILVEKYVFEAPYYTDTEHVLEVSTRLDFIDGRMIDNNSKQFIVKPASILRISLNPKPREPQFFLIFVNESYFFIKALDETIVGVPSNAEITIVGPSLNKREMYVPQKISVGRLSLGEKRNITITLCPGAVARVLAAVPSISTLKIPLQETRILMLNKTQERLILEYSSENLSLLNLLNITGNIVVVPADTPLHLLVSTSIEGKRNVVEIGSVEQPVKLYRNSETNLDQPALTQARSNQPFVNKTIELAMKMVEEARSLGFYIGLEAYRLNQIITLGAEALNSSNPLKILSYQQEAIVTGEEVTRSIQRILREAYTNAILVFTIVVALSLAIGAIFIEKKEQYATFTIISFLILMTTSYHTFPGFSKTPIQELMIGVYLAMFIILAVFLVPYFLGEVKSEKGVSLIPALTIAISYSIGNLKRRRLRTLLTLISIITMAIAMSTLTSMRASLATNTLTVAKTCPSDKPPMSIVSRPSEFLTSEDLIFIGSQKEILSLDYKVVSPIAYGAIDYVDGVPIYGIRSISVGDPSFHFIKGITYPENSMDRLFNSSNTVLVSKHLAKSLGIEVGNVIYFKGLRLAVVGIFDGDLIREIKEPDGSEFSPFYVPPGSQSGAQPVPGNNLLIANVQTSKKLGGSISAVYCLFNNNMQAREASKRLASLGGYFVATLPSSESLTYYFRGGYVEIFGTLIVFPITITVLNIAIMFYTLIYERRNEIFVFSSVGLNPTHISSLFIVEAGVLGFIGGGIGYILSMIMFRLLDILNIVLPVNVKTSPIDMLSLITIASLTAIFASVPPALKAARITTPSLLRKWKIEEKAVRGETWKVRVPLRIPLEKVEMFINYLYERLPQSSTAIELVISEVKREEKIDENGNISYLISFNYGRGGNRPFNAHTTIEVRKDIEDYAVYVYTSPKSVYASLIETNVHEVVTHVRKLVLEWSALKFSLAMAIGESVENAFNIIKKYRPQLLVAYSRKELGDKLKVLRRRLRSEGVWPPTIEVRRLDFGDISILADKLCESIRSVDAVCLDSDDGILSSALLLAAIRLDKNIVTIDPQGNIHEFPARKFVENL
ncbi:MAG: FtsX-like permease family protein [Thermoproteota archaeon]